MQVRNINEWIRSFVLANYKDEDSKWVVNNLEKISLLFTKPIKHILEEGSLILLAHNNYEWFCQYVLARVNGYGDTRPFLYFVKFPALIFDYLDDEEDLEGFLSTTYRKHMLWYIGDASTQRALFSNKNGIIWDVSAELFSSKNNDVNLLMLYELFEKAIFAAIHTKYKLN